MGLLLTRFSTTPTEVYDTLTHLKPGKTPGLDEIPPQLLRHCARGISNSLCALFNRSLEDCCVPSQWKEAFIVPIHKGGSKSDPSNYRPIALSSIVSKVLENSTPTTQPLSEACAQRQTIGF